MKIKLSYRDVIADTTDIHHDQSETPENNPKDNKGLLKMKPQVDVRIKIDKERTNIEEQKNMGINSRNLMSVGK